MDGADIAGPDSNRGSPVVLRAQARRGGPVDPDLAPHQREAVAKLSSGKILKGGTGSGKTRTALAYFVETGLPPWTPLYIITTAKKRDDGDWQEECKLW